MTERRRRFYNFVLTDDRLEISGIGCRAFFKQRRFFGKLEPVDTVSFHHITKILELTDQLGISREWVEIPLSPASPGMVRKMENGKLEIVVDAEAPFETWLASLENRIRAVMNGQPDPGNSEHAG